MTPRNRRLTPQGGAPPAVAPFPIDGGAARTLVEAPPGRLAAALRAIVGAVLVLGLSLGVAWAARRHVLSSPRFAVEEVIVLGAHQRTPEALALEAGIVRGMNIFTVDLARARARLLSDPWVETATLTRQLPGKVFVRVTERELGAIVALPETYLASRDGRVFKPLAIGDPSDLPIITGVTSEALVLDREGSQRWIARALDLAQDYDHGSSAQHAPLQEIHVSNGGEMTLVVGKDGVNVALGLPPFRRKLEEAARIFVELERRSVHPTVIMLDDEARPDRVVVRTR